MQILHRTSCLPSIVLTCCTFFTINSEQRTGDTIRMREPKVPRLSFQRIHARPTGSVKPDGSGWPFSEHLAIILSILWAIVTVSPREAWKSKLPFRLAPIKAFSDKMHGSAHVALDLDKSFPSVLRCLPTVWECLFRNWKGRWTSIVLTCDQRSIIALVHVQDGKPIGAKTVDLEWSKKLHRLRKFRLPRSPKCSRSATRAGGLVFNTHGNRFAKVLSSQTRSQGDVEVQASFPPRSKRCRAFAKFCEIVV